MALEAPRILLVDSYDSFTHNLAALCRRSIPNCQIRIIQNDELTIEELRPQLKTFSAVVVGPGPGSPDNPADVGIVRDLWHLEGGDLLPIFGVCLGLQSLAIEFGAELKRLRTVKHGLISRIHHVGTDIFQGVGDAHAVRYHSLHVAIPAASEEIQELAWADDEENGRVVMGLKHTSKPFWGVQYHPESVRTNGGGWEVLANFWNQASHWVQANRSPQGIQSKGDIGTAWPHIPFTDDLPPSPLTPDNVVLSTKLHLPQLTSAKVSEYFGASDELSNFVLLDSAASPGRYSIIGSLLPDSLHVTYYLGDDHLTLSREKESTTESLGDTSIWEWLSNYMQTRRVDHHNSPIPFWGGFIGYLSYEIGYPTLHLPPPNRKQQRHPDVNLIFVERSVVTDNQTGDVHIQSLIPQDEGWIVQIAQDLSKLTQSKTGSNRCSRLIPSSPTPVVTLPEKQRYISRIKQAKEHLYAGDSYELCLTARTRVSIPSGPSPPPANTSTSWERYQNLRQTNPAPHSAYLRLHPTTLISSSPERFLSFSRAPNPMCQLRPIKGTVRKGPGITRAVAERLLAGSPKEVAENLMIVDLIRHDLHGVLGEDVKVTKFCGVEEYETVWQLVSVIEGKHEKGSSKHYDYDLGWNVLRSSLPPGKSLSMTGAPKKRSVEILQHLEDGEREVYSGVFGYWDVGGGGDWSVTIRSCFKFDDSASTKSPRSGAEEWSIGAGGAITALSDPEAEWDEMILKLQSVLKSFGITQPMSA
uniref:aminodeoxychorismate synthase n=2 Tax=Coprinellus disseminatus TaxID=71703 RepID=Q1WMU1_COPDI|nr:para-aminobenzoic acid synthetase [Coprinellus disseminatus]